MLTENLRAIQYNLLQHGQSLSTVATSPRALKSTASTQSLRFIDIAVNLTDRMFFGEYNGKPKHTPDLEAVIQRALSSGCERMILTGGSLQDSKDVLALARKFDPHGNHLFTTVGVHPTRCNEFLDSPEQHLNELRALIQENRDRVVAVGEMGLDFDRLQFCDKETQLRFFAAQIPLAKEFNLPMFLHMREACDAFCGVLPAGSVGVAHSFTGTLEEAKKLMALGLHIGLNGCSLKTEENLAVAKEIPLTHLHLETDAPYCDIRPTHAGFKFVKTVFPAVKKPEKFEVGMQVKSRYEPCNIVQVAEVISGVKGIPITELAETVLMNSLKMFPVEKTPSE